MALTGDSLMKELLASEEAKAILKQHLGKAWLEAPQMQMGLNMTLNQVAKIPSAGVTEEKLKAIIEDLSKI